MDQARTDLGAATHTAEPVSSTGISSAWDAYYKEASRRRRANGRHHFRTDGKKVRRRRERIAIGFSTLFVAAMTTAFYFVLR